MLHAVIMAGGAGTRFWPESRVATPKQLLRLVGDRSMIRLTVDRLGDLVTPERTLIVTNQRLVSAIAAELPELPPNSILGEPCKRDTAPCVGLAAMQLLRHDPDATMVVMPADHVIRPDDTFQEAIRYAVGLIDARPGRIVTFGIQPTYPAETFGYIERGTPLDENQTYGVRRFREKPDAATARQYLAEGSNYWNSGIFLWRASTILAALADFQPTMYERLHRIDAAWHTADYQEVLDREFTAIDAVSIDYAVMERATDVVVIEAPFEWDDVGSWQSLARLSGTDADGNTAIGKHLAVNTKGTIIRGEDDRLIVTLGLTDCIVVQTPDATLVANKHDEESIRQVVRQLGEKRWTEHL